jgi:excisionase family DNA binding protein
VSAKTSNRVHLTPALAPERRGSELSAACVTRSELAALLQVSLRTVDRMIASGEIPVRRVHGKTVRFLRSDVDAYLCEPVAAPRANTAVAARRALPTKGGAQ